MKKIQSIYELYEELYSNGAKYIPLNDILDYEQPSKYIVNSTEYNNDYSTPVLTAGQSFILGYTNENSGIYQASKSNPVIIFDDFTTSFHWVDFNFKVKSSAIKILKPKLNIDLNFRYVYYSMRCINFIPKEHARHWISQYSKFKIPIPPIELQNEIVKILDTFMELEAELEARKKQYEYYRNRLLTFKEHAK
jgi:type I restriction enzyme, S subunit